MLANEAQSEAQPGTNSTSEAAAVPLLKFPGYSLEKSLDILVEDSGFSLTDKAIFVEVRRPNNRGQWVFDFDLSDKKFFSSSGSGSGAAKQKHS